MTVEKYYNEQGEVGVLISPGFGAGWSTWAHSESDDIVFDKTIVEMVIGGKHHSLIEKYAREKYKDICVAGADQLVVEFVPENTKFSISVYDGYERLDWTGNEYTA